MSKDVKQNTKAKAQIINLIGQTRKTRVANTELKHSYKKKTQCLVFFVIHISFHFAGCENADHCGMFVCNLLDAPADLWLSVGNLR